MYMKFIHKVTNSREACQVLNQTISNAIIGKG